MSRIDVNRLSTDEGEVSNTEFGEPWLSGDSETDTHVAFHDSQFGHSVAMSPDHYERARLCVNALAGLRPENLQALIEACEQLLEYDCWDHETLVRSLHSIVHALHAVKPACKAQVSAPPKHSAIVGDDVPLKPFQLETLRAVHDFWTTHQHGPSVRELASILKVASTNTIHFRVKLLLTRLFLSQAGGALSRTLRVTDKGRAYLEAHL